MDVQQRKEILWVDDQIEHLEPYCKILRERGFAVEPAGSATEALTKAHDKTFDLFLVDLRMPQMDGVDLLRQLNSVHRQRNAVFAAFSSFLYLQRYQDRLTGLGFNVPRLDKDFPPTDCEESELTERFIAPIEFLAKHGKNAAVIKEKDQNRDSEVSPFDIPLNEFLRLSITEKEASLDKAAAIASTAIERAFSEGKIWVLLCGSERAIRASASTPDEIMSERQIMDFARRLECAPYQFFRTEPVEDMWAPCQGRYYPTVTLEVPTKDGSNQRRPVKVNVHFDTGAPMSFFSYEDLLDLGVIHPSSLVGGTYTRKGYQRKYRALALKLNAVLECQRGLGTKHVTINGQIVRDWESSPYARTCDDSCPLDKMRPEFPALKSCPFRVGIVGRNLLTENDMVIVLDGQAKQTGFEKL